VPERKELYRFIGPTLAESFGEFCGLTGEDIDRAIALYREYYRPFGIHQNLLYDGIEQVLCRLHDAGKTLLVATSKPEPFAREILEGFGLAGYFTYIAGASFDESRGDKAEVIAYALESAGITAGENVVMVGDRKYDVIGARQHGLDCIAVLSGYGNRQEFKQAGARYILDHVNQVADFLL
jgi:phosphoglycolate phosphatase